MDLGKEFWDNHYKINNLGWDISYPSPPLTDYINQLDNKNIKILIPGCGNAYEGAYLMEQGFQNTYLLDYSPTALNNFKKLAPNFPEKQIICGDFFNHQSQYNLIFEQTFFCSLDPKIRDKYALHMSSLLKPRGKLVGVLFNTPLNTENPPFGGSAEEYANYFRPYFSDVSIEPCHNSIKPRLGNEVFIILTK